MSNSMIVLQYIKNYINDNGWAPSVREISASLNAASTGTANYHLTQLQARGYIIRKARTARALRLTEDGNNALYAWNVAQSAAHTQGARSPSPS
jgi:repressor LexA